MSSGIDATADSCFLCVRPRTADGRSRRACRKVLKEGSGVRPGTAGMQSPRGSCGPSGTPVPNTAPYILQGPASGWSVIRRKIPVFVPEQQAGKTLAVHPDRRGRRSLTRPRIFCRDQPPDGPLSKGRFRCSSRNSGQAKPSRFIRTVGDAGPYKDPVCFCRDQPPDGPLSEGRFLVRPEQRTGEALAVHPDRRGRRSLQGPRMFL